MSKEDHIDVYRRYLARFEELFGNLDFEDAVQHKGKLIQKLRYEQFIARWSEFRQIEEYLREVMTKGATLNDEVNRTYRELAISVLENPKDFMML